MANNNKMDNKSRLLKIGFEGFDMLEEEEYGRKGRPPVQKVIKKAPAPAWPPVFGQADQVKKAPAPAPAWHPVFRQADQTPAAQACHYQYQPPPTIVYQMKNPVSSTEEIINSYEAVKLHDGQLILDYSKRKSATMAY